MTGSPWFRRRSVGRLGEDIAALVLRRHGACVVDRNVTVGRGELDLVATDGHERFVVEVKTLVAASSDNNPAEAFTSRKEQQVRTLAGRLRPPVRRVDLVSVELRRDGARVRWTPGVG